jgi:site-specific DNA recombinase
VDGGLPPLGYDVKEKGLVINSAEAEIVRTIFELYLDLGSMSKVKKEVDRLMLRTKERNYGGKVTGGKPFSRGHLYHLIKNPLYAGQVRYKDKVYEGQHDAIINHSMWLETQSKLKAGNAQRISQTNQKHPNLLTGLVYDTSGSLLSPHYTMKKDRRYRYYVSSSNLSTNIKGWRIAAPELENTIVEILIRWLEDRNQVYRTFADIIEEHPETAEILIKNIRVLSQKLRSNQPSEIRELISALIMRIEISKSELGIALDKKQIIEKLGLSISIQDNDKSIQINSVHQIKRRGQEKKIIIQGAQQLNKDLKLISLVSRSHRWLQDIKNGQVKTISDIAKIERMDDGDVSRFFQFAFLAPEIVTSILEGTQPADLTVEKLKRLGTLPLCWSEQKSRLGY